MMLAKSSARRQSPAGTSAMANSHLSQDLSVTIGLECGKAYENLERTNKALEDYSQSIHVNPNVVQAYINRGFIYFQLGMNQKGMNDCNKAIQINSSYADAYGIRAIGYYAIGKYDRAWQDVHKVQSLGAQIHPGFLNALREASGRPK